MSQTKTMDCACMKLTIRKEDLLQVIKDHPGEARRILVTALENALLEETMIMTRGNFSKTAEILGMNRGIVSRKYKALCRARARSGAR